MSLGDSYPALNSVDPQPKQRSPIRIHKAHEGWYNGLPGSCRAFLYRDPYHPFLIQILQKVATLVVKVDLRLEALNISQPRLGSGCERPWQQEAEDHRQRGDGDDDEVVRGLWSATMAQKP